MSQVVSLFHNSWTTKFEKQCLHRDVNTNSKRREQKVDLLCFIISMIQISSSVSVSNNQSNDVPLKIARMKDTSASKRKHWPPSTQPCDLGT